MTKLADSCLLVTGGASGIGKLMGEKALQAGVKTLVIWDIQEQPLESIKADLASQGYRVVTQVVDITDAAAVAQAADYLRLLSVFPDILINNAGIVVGKSFAEHSYADIEKTMSVNTLGAMYVTKAFLPDMIRHGNGHIVNIASAAGLLPNPRMSVYAASKWAMLGWSESLRLELEQLDSDLHVTTVTPSYIDTGMFAGVKAPLLTPILKPDEITEAILKAIEQNKIILRKPAVVHLLPFFRGLLPTRLFDCLVGRGFKVYTSMNHFTGRKTSQGHSQKKLA